MFGHKTCVGLIKFCCDCAEFL